MKYFLIILSVFVLTTTVIHAQSEIRNVDFQNFTYMPSCAGEEPERVTVAKGEFSREKQVDGYTDRFYFRIVSVAFGDLNGDKQDEAVVLSVCNTGGTGQFSEGFVYTLKSGKPALIARVPGGDRADGGLRTLNVEGGLLVVEFNDPKENRGACCPEFAIKTKNRLVGDKLIEVGKYVRRELFPKERIVFAKGSSEKTFTVKIAPDDRKRYTVGARAGQILSVSINSNDATLTLLGDLETTEGTNQFSAKLPANDDYTFEVANYGEKEIEVTITVKIT